MSKSEQFRQRAAQMRTLADAVSFAESRAALLQSAELWDEMATTLESVAANDDRAASASWARVRSRALRRPPS